MYNFYTNTLQCILLHCLGKFLFKMILVQSYFDAENMSRSARIRIATSLLNTCLASIASIRI